jgi:hypothetical protein
VDAIKDALSKAKDFVTDHQVAIAAGVATVVTAAACIALQRSAVKEWNEFLAIEGLTEKFYSSVS